MKNNDIEEAANYYASHVDGGGIINENGKAKIKKWCKEDFIAGANWMKEQLKKE